jgi:hypothetical protein
MFWKLGSAGFKYQPRADISDCGISGPSPFTLPHIFEDGVAVLLGYNTVLLGV